MSVKRFYFMRVKARNRNFLEDEQNEFQSAMPAHGKFLKDEAPV